MCDQTLQKSFSVILDKNATGIFTSVLLSNGNEKMTVNAKWDTGAYMSFVPKQVVDRLSLIPIDTMITRGTFGGNVNTNVYEVDITIPGDYTFEKLKVLCAIDDCTTDYMLIGMDIISHGDFLFSGHGNGIFSFRVPSTKTVSFNLL